MKYTKSELTQDGMALHAAAAFIELQTAGCPVKTWADEDRGHFWIDAEEMTSSKWLNYWNLNLVAGSDKLNQILQKHDLYFEWVNPGYAHVYDI